MHFVCVNNYKLVFICFGGAGGHQLSFSNARAHSGREAPLYTTAQSIVSGQRRRWEEKKRPNEQRLVLWRQARRRAAPPEKFNAKSTSELGARRGERGRGTRRARPGFMRARCNEGDASACECGRTESTSFSLARFLNKMHRNVRTAGGIVFYEGGAASARVMRAPHAVVGRRADRPNKNRNFERGVASAPFGQYETPVLATSHARSHGSARAANVPTAPIRVELRARRRTTRHASATRKSLKVFGRISNIAPETAKTKCRKTYRFLLRVGGR